ncbi:class I SAM-dependent methyltransferase [Yunchengibacter salinarum]|uniref:class I SAM-dependent methyltransferase n=1 Tax=Yunchengibacter salinarum TaxID=3133399 RepID=UPI0035B5B997
MHPDIHQMRHFYGRSLGRSVSDLLGGHVADLWSDARDLLVLGIGYAPPVLEPLAALGANTLAAMPARQGVCHWPRMADNRSLLVDVARLPFDDSAVDRVVLLHALEHARRPAIWLREIWRVLAPGGQVLVAVPNRRRTWSAIETTPFGHGHPYSRAQLMALMRDQLLPPDYWDTALMLPPVHWPGVRRTAALVERPVHMLGRGLGGVLLVRAHKQVYGAIESPAKAPHGVRMATRP